MLHAADAGLIRNVLFISLFYHLQANVRKGYTYARTMIREIPGQVRESGLPQEDSLFSQP